jgi:hypothetical protein
MIGGLMSFGLENRVFLTINKQVAGSGLKIKAPLLLQRIKVLYEKAVSAFGFATRISLRPELHLLFHGQHN